MAAKKQAKTFRKTDLVTHVEKQTDWSKRECREAVEAVMDGITKGLKRADKVQISGFGAWTKKKIPARKGGKLVKNPFTGELVKQKSRPAQTRIKFRPATGLKSI